MSLPLVFPGASLWPSDVKEQRSRATSKLISPCTIWTTGSCTWCHPLFRQRLCHHRGAEEVLRGKKRPGAYGVHVDEPARLLTRLLEPFKTEPQIHFIRPLTALQALECGGRGRGAIIPERKGETQSSLDMTLSTATTLGPPTVSSPGVTR